MSSVWSTVRGWAVEKECKSAEYPSSCERSGPEGAGGQGTVLAWRQGAADQKQAEHTLHSSVCVCGVQSGGWVCLVGVSGVGVRLEGVCLVGVSSLHTMQIHEETQVAHNEAEGHCSELQRLPLGQPHVVHARPHGDAPSHSRAGLGGQMLASQHSLLSLNVGVKLGRFPSPFGVAWLSCRAAS